MAAAAGEEVLVAGPGNRPLSLLSPRAAGPPENPGLSVFSLEKADPARPPLRAVVVSQWFCQVTPRSPAGFRVVPPESVSSSSLIRSSGV